MKKFVVSCFILLAITFSFSEYLLTFPSLDSKIVFFGNYDLINSGGVCTTFSQTLGGFVLNGSLNFNFNMNFSFLTSLGFQLAKNQNFSFLGYLDFAKFKDYAFGLTGLFVDLASGIKLYGRTFYSFSDVPHLIADAGVTGRFSIFDVNVGSILIWDFQTFISLSPNISLDVAIGSLLIRLGYYYQPYSYNLQTTEKHVVSFGVGWSSTNNIRYSVFVSKNEYFEDEVVSLVIRRTTPLSLNTYGKIIVSILDNKENEVYKQEYSVEQANINISRSLNPGSYKIVLKKSGNFELVTEQASKNSFFVKSVPNAKIYLPSVVTRKQKYDVEVFVSSSDSYPSDITVKLDGREVKSERSFVPNNSLNFELLIEELGEHKIEIYADDKEIGQQIFEVRSIINAEWVNRLDKVLTLQEMSLNPPKFRFLEVFDDRAEPYSNQEVKFVIKKEGKTDPIEVIAYTNKEGMALIPMAWENGIYSIQVEPVDQKYTKIAFLGRENYVIRIEPVPKEMVLSSEQSEAVYIDEKRKTILISRDKLSRDSRSVELNIDIQDELGDSIRSGFLKVSVFKPGIDGKLRDISQDFNLTDRINLSTKQNDPIRIPVDIPSKAETGEYYFFFEIYSDSSKDAQSRWVDVYKVILYKETILNVENLTIPGIVKKNVVIRGEPNRLKFVFMWKDGEPVRNLKVNLICKDRKLEGYTNEEGEMIVLVPEPEGDNYEFSYSILYYDDHELTVGNGKMRVEKLERSVQVPNTLTVDLADLGQYKREVKLFMDNFYDFLLKDDNNTELLKGRTSGLNISKMFEEIYLPIEPRKTPVVINLFDDKRNLLKIDYSVYGVVLKAKNMKGKEYFLGTFTSGTIAQIPISTKISESEELSFDEFIIVPHGNYFIYRIPSPISSNSNMSLELRPAKLFALRLIVEDDEGVRFENPARYSIYYREKGKESYIGSVMPGLDATISIPDELKESEFINLLRVYRDGYQIDFDVDDVVIDQNKNLVMILVKIANQQDLISDFNLEVTVKETKVQTQYEIFAYSPRTFYGIPLYSKLIYEKGRGRNLFGPTKNFSFTIYLPELDLNTYLEGIEISQEKTKLPIEITKLANVTLCEFNFEEIQYQGAKAIIKVDGREVWKDTINKNATFPVPNGIRTIELILDKYSLPIKIVKDFRKDLLKNEFKVKVCKEVPNIPPYLLKGVIYYPKEDSVSKLYKRDDEIYMIPLELVSKIKYLRFEQSGTLFIMDNSYGFEKDINSENAYKLRYGGKEKQLKIPEKSFVSIDFYPLDDNRVVLGFKPSSSDFAENVSLISRSMQSYSVVGTLWFTERLSESPPLTFVMPSVSLTQQGVSDLKVKIYGYSTEKKFILPIDISKLDRSQVVESDVIRVDGIVYAFSLKADPNIGNRTQRIYLKQPGEYFIEYVGSTLQTLVINLPDDLDNYQQGIDGIYLIGR